ncbi:MAG: pseudouridine-5'-phosphate glycosidase [Chitinophagaceae bacterium]|nr:pseudouridine-5'-phosphate glycosidase [Chitinophagaceae bacterium]
MEEYIQQALVAANEKRITGKNITPFLLQYIAEQTKGEGLEANIALIKHHATVGAGLAVLYVEIN